MQKNKFLISLFMVIATSAISNVMYAMKKTIANTTPVKSFENYVDSDSVRSAIISSAVGDALGRVTEFKKSMEAIFQIYPQGVSNFNDFTKADWEHIPKKFTQNRIAPYTDDTAMAKLVLEVLIDARRNNYTLDQTMGAIARAFVHDMHDEQLGWAAGFRAPGVSTMKAVKILEQKIKNKQTSDKNWWAVGLAESGGCGSVMRAYPFGILFYDNPEKAGEWAAQHSLLTHAHPWAQAACAAMAVGMALVLNPAHNPEYIIQQMIQAAKKYDEGTAHKMEDAVALARISRNKLSQISRPKSSGFIQHALQNKEYRKFHAQVFSTYAGWRADDAIAATAYVFALFPNDIESALYVSVNTPGDSDSIAAMAGALVGARDKHMPLFFKQVEGYAYFSDVDLSTIFL